MKNLKKILALLVAALLVVVSMSAMAADGDGMVNPQTDGQIMIAGLSDGDTITFYQVLEWSGNDKDTEAFGGWKLTAAFKAFANDFAATSELSNYQAAVKALIGDPQGNPAVPMGLTSAYAGKLADLAAAAPAGTGKAGSTVANGKSTLDIGGTSGNTVGMYMALITPADANTLYNPVFVSADYNKTNGTESWEIATSASTYSDSGAAKKSLLDVDKKDVGSTGSYDLTWRSTKPGEKVQYEVTTSIPGYGEVYQNPVFKITDQLDGLDLDAGSLKVYVDGTQVSLTDTTKIKASSATSGGYTIEFEPTYLKTVASPKTVFITYEATVKEGLKQNVDTEHNEVWVEYTHDPTDENDKDYKKDDTEHYTYTIDAKVLAGYESGIRYSGTEIVKVAVDASGNPINEIRTSSWIEPDKGWNGPLEGALFTLYQDDFSRASDGTISGTIYSYKANDDSTVQLKDIPSDGAGRIELPELDAGTYYLVETYAPNGFIKTTDEVKIEIKPTFKDQTVTMYTNGTKWVYADDPDYNSTDYPDAATYTVEVLDHVDIYINDVNTTSHVYNNPGKKEIKESDLGTKELPSSIINTKGVELPSTGGIGTTIFYVGGSILVLLAGVLLVTKRRMSAGE